jgi:2,3-bisphosphoglycerate-independent phosphoglycerate mutase
VGAIASVVGRYYAMDRDHRWERVERAYRLLTRTPADPEIPVFEMAEPAVLDYYEHPSAPTQQGDEFITPRAIAVNGRSAAVAPGDAVIFFNFRGDRPREITKAFVYDESQLRREKNGGFDRGPRIENLWFCTFTAYEEGLPVNVAFPKPPRMKNILGEVISSAGLTQFRCAETEKFAHVTFFFNDYREAPYPGEHRVIVPSPTDVSTYDQKPGMSAAAVRDAVLERLRARDCEPLIVVNFANGDMVGHTGVLPAAIEAIETVDACAGSIVDETLRRGGSAIVTADHGNAEQMWDPQANAPHTAHTNFPVPLIIVGERFRGRTLRSGGRLADIAPTILDMIGFPRPAEMTGESLLA